MMANSQWTTDDFLSYGWGGSKSKDCALMRLRRAFLAGQVRQLGISARKGVHSFRYLGRPKI
jgi:hypothetical protein